MRLSRWLAVIALTLAVSGSMVVPAGATTLIRQGLESLTAQNELVVFGRVLDIHSYWNAERTHVLTDIRVRTEKVLKGAVPANAEIQLTLLGGTVGEWTTLLVGGPELVPGSDYILFLSPNDLLPGIEKTYMVPDHIQGVFDVTDAPALSERRAISQGLKHPLSPDAQGRIDVPGGEEGLPLEAMFEQISKYSGLGATH